jgi:hypothetical protein
MPKITSSNSACEFWSASEHNCKVCNSGLFIPLGDHIEIYCKTAEHTLCIQYNMNIQQESSEESVTAENRRQHIRIKEQCPITLVRLNESGNIVSHLSEKVNILDLSLGGMRVNSRKMLLNDSIVQFTFSAHDNDSPQSGIAKVRWSCAINNDTLYQVGLEFQSDQTIEVIGKHLGQTI